MKLSPLPDPSITVEEMIDYGYEFDEMLPLNYEKAVELFEKGVEIYLLHPDNVETIVKEKADIDNFKKQNGIYGVVEKDWNKFLYAELDSEDINIQNNLTFNNNTSPDILNLYWNKKTEEAYLTVNPEAFPIGSDLTKQQKLCDDFGEHYCNNIVDYSQILEQSNAVREKIGQLSPKPTHEFLAKHIPDDALVPEFRYKDEDFRVTLNWNKEYSLAWFEPFIEPDMEQADVYKAENLCKNLGVYQSKNSSEYDKLLNGLGEDAIKSGDKAKHNEMLEDDENEFLP